MRKRLTRPWKRLGSGLLSLLLIIPMTAPLGLESGRAVANVRQPKPPSPIRDPIQGTAATAIRQRQVPVEVTVESRGHWRDGQAHLEYAAMTVTLSPAMFRRRDPGFKVGVEICVRAAILLNSTIKKDLVANVGVVATSGVSLPIVVKWGAVICDGGIEFKPAAKGELGINCDVIPFGCQLEGCLELEVAVEAGIDCVGKKVASVNILDIGKVELGHCRVEPSAATGANQSANIVNQSADVAPLSPSPSVASNGQGRALAVRLQEESPDPTTPRRRLYFSLYNGTTWSPASRLSAEDALVEAPRVAFLGPNRAVAVWLQSKLTWEQALASDEAGLLTRNELYYALRDGRAWSVPAPITDDEVVDTPPALAADPATGRAMLAWLRINPAGSPPPGLAWSSFDGRR